MKAKLMNFFKLLPILTLMAIVFSPKVLAQSSSNSEPRTEVNAPSSPHNTSRLERYLRWREFFEEDGQSSSGHRTDQGSRGNCLKNDDLPPLAVQPLTALIREINLEPTEVGNSNSVFGKTVDGYPTFWFYVPYETSMVNNAKFNLLDEDQNSVLTEPISVSLSGTPGLVSVTLPTTEKELEIGQKYRWFFELEYDADHSSENTQVRGWVEGWVQRVAPIPGIEPDDYIAYAEQGIWYNALTPLVRMRQQHGQNLTLQNDWVDLLKAVELESLADVSVADCCDDMKRANRP